MDTTTQEIGPVTVHFHRFLVLTWDLLRRLRTTGILLAVLALVFGLALVLPQSSDPEISEGVWVALLPAGLQRWGGLLFGLGFSQIFQSLWFWLPVALLGLNSLIALADYLPPSWQRFRDAPAELAWQHPLASRVEYSSRLPAAPDEFLEQLKEKLQAQGFVIDKTVDETRRPVSARHRAWSWLSLPAVYASLLLLCLGFLASRYSVETDQMTLAPFETKASPLLGGTFELSRFDPASGAGTVLRCSPAQAETAEPFTWQLYRPTFLGDALIIPLEAIPVLTVEAEDAAGEPRTLFSPLPDDRSPATKLNLPLSNPDQPLYFVIPSASLAFQIIPPPAGETGYNVQVRRNAETISSESLAVQSGEPFEVDDLSVTLALNHSLRLAARRDWGLPFYLLSLLGLLGALLACFLFPPWQLWLIPEVKGRGGQLYGVVEKLGSAGTAPQFLEQLLTQDNPALEPPEPEP